MIPEKDTYLTIEGDVESSIRERGSKFLGFAFAVRSEQEIKEKLEPLKKKYYDATHHCYAWRLGPYGERTRANDDGEPSGTAGKPILNQILSAELTDVLVVVVRYFGGTKLGVPGLIAAYKDSAREVLEQAGIVEIIIEEPVVLCFSYEKTNDVMRIAREVEARIGSQSYDGNCRMEIFVRKGRSAQLRDRLGDFPFITAEWRAEAGEKQ